MTNQDNRTGNQNSGKGFPGHDVRYMILAFLLSLVIGWIDLQVTEVMVTILMLLSGGLLFGLIQPVAAWRWGILLVIGLPIMELAAMGLGFQTAEPVQVDLRITLVALAFTLLGAYSGVLIRNSLRNPAGKND